MMRRVIINSISKITGGNFFEAENGEQALELLNQQEIDFIVTDWVMPVMDGISFLQNLKQDATLSKIPVLMVTTKTTKTDLVEAFSAKIDDYIVKPISAEVMERKIRGIIDRRESFAV
jgi:two-component system chemotaxis response regulator CheY